MKNSTTTPEISIEFTPDFSDKTLFPPRVGDDASIHNEYEIDSIL